MQKGTHNLTRTALFAAVMAVSAYIRIPIGPVPLTMQSAAALIAGYSLGPVWGPMSTLLYTAIGLAGFPVFASGGGPAYILLPTFGYIIGFSICAFISGFLALFNVQGSVSCAYLIMLAGLIGIYFPGVLWLLVALHWIADAPESIVNILKIGFIIPLVGDLLTTLPAAALSVRLRKILS